MSLTDLQVLRELVVLTPLSNIAYALGTARSWWCPTKYQAAAAFKFVIRVPPADDEETILLRNVLTAGDIKIVLQGCDLHIHGPVFRGLVFLFIWAGNGQPVRSQDRDYLEELIGTLRADPLVMARSLEWKV